MIRRVTTEPYQLLRSARPVTVDVRAAWEDEWTTLRAREVVTTKSLGSISVARFVTHYGEIFKKGDTQIQIQGPVMSDWIGAWVRIQATAEAGVYTSVADPALADKDPNGNPIPDPEQPGNWIQTDPYKWYGVITDVSPSYRGTRTNDELVKVVTEDSLVTCHSLEWLLSRQQVSASLIEKDGFDPKRINRGLIFNEWRSDKTGHKMQVGNKGKEINPDFSEDLAEAELWTSEDAINYLLRHFAPTDGTTTPQTAPRWTLFNGTSINWLTPTVRTHNRTLYDIIGDFVPRNRGLSWEAVMDEDTGEIRIVIHSYAEDDVTLPSGETLPGNPNKVELDILEQRHISSTIKAINEQTRYQQVIVQGARVGRVFSITVSGDLNNDWSAAEETDYKDGANGLPGYGAMEFAEKARHNDSARQSAKHRHVYTTFSMPKDWDGVLDANSINVRTMDNEFPDAEWWNPGLRFESTLPLVERHDYSTDPTGPDNTQLREYRKPFAAIALGPWYETLEHLNSQTYDEISGGQGYACYLRMQRERLGITCQPTGVPHLLARADFLPDQEEPTDQVPYDNYQGIEATVYLRGDEYCEGKWPDNPDPKVHDQESVLVISVGERARLDWLAEGTMLDVVDSTPVRAAVSGFIRDDREYCQDLARSAWEFYGRPRTAIRYELNMTSTHVEIGELVTEFKEGDLTIEVNSIVSAVTINWQSGRTDVQTQFAELETRGAVFA